MLIYADCFVGLTLDGTGMENADMVSESFFESCLSDLAISDQIVSEVTCPILIEKLHREYGIAGYGEVRV